MQASAEENAKLCLELACMRTANASLEMHLRALESPGAGEPAVAGVPSYRLTRSLLHPVVLSLHKEVCSQWLSLDSCPVASDLGCRPQQG